MPTVNFTIGDNFPSLMHDLRWDFRENPSKVYENLRQAIPDVSHNTIDAFLRGKLDVGIENGQPFFFETQNDLTQEIIEWVEQQYVKAGEDIESYWGGIVKVDEFVVRSNYKWNADYEEDREDHLQLYRGHYDRAVKKFQEVTKSLEWFYRNWAEYGRQKPYVRALNEIINAERLSQYALVDAKEVNYHALVMTVDGKIWWYGKNSTYAIFQHENLRHELFKLGANASQTLDYRSTGWTGSLHGASSKQIDALVQFALDRDELSLIFNDSTITVENLLKFKNGEIKLYEIC